MLKLKNTFLIVFILFISITQSYAQNKETLDIIAKETCECINKQNLKNMDANELQMSLGLCMIQSLSNHPNEIDYDISNPDSMEKLGEKVGIRMAFHCPEVFQKLAQEPELMETILEEKENSRSYSLQGKIKDVKGEKYLHIILEDEQGRQHELLWLRYFSGSENFLTNPKKMIGKRVKISYQKIECYIPDAKDYFDRKEIKTLEIL